jgi:uncharacterized protein
MSHRVICFRSHLGSDEYFSCWRMETHRAEMAEMSWLFWLTFDGVRSAAEVNVPTIMVHSDGWVFPEHAKAVYAALKGPKQLEWNEGSQIDFYDQEAQVRAVSIAAPHFRATLGSD